MAKTTKKFIMIGTFPPPVHGMAAVNQAVQERLLGSGWTVHKLDTAPRSLDRSIVSHIGRIIKIVCVWLSLFTFYLKKENQKTATYLALSGGWGQVYDLITVLLCKILGAAVIIHHHSFAYLNKYRKLSQLIFNIAGINTGHVVLCNRMREILKSRYRVKNVHVLSNVVMFPVEQNSRERSMLRTAGFLSNITREKGGEVVIDLAYAIRKFKLPLKVVVAGPCHDKELAVKLEKAEKEGVLQWKGPVYENDKVRFWNEIDVFIFPTQNEAEPLVLWEAAAAGVPVIAYSRGCIEEQVTETGGIAVPIEDNFIEAALSVLNSWSQNPELYKTRTVLARRYFSEMGKQLETSWEEFEQLLSNPNNIFSGNG